MPDKPEKILFTQQLKFAIFHTSSTLIQYIPQFIHEYESSLYYGYAALTSLQY